MLTMLSALIGPVSAILDKAIPDKDLKEKLAHEIATKLITCYRTTSSVLSKS
jgi:hypothetical protein